MYARDLVRVIFRPAGRSVHVPKGTLLTAAANQLGVAIEQICGGKGTCGKCRVKLLSGTLGPVSDSERRHLSADDLAAGYRLACQAGALSDVSVEVGWASAAAGVSILVEGLLEPVPLEPLVQKVAVQVPQASLEDQVGDYEALQRVLPTVPGEAPRATLDALRELPAVVRAAGGLLTAVRAGGLLLSVEPGDTRQALYGFACDIGTTTVVGYLLDLTTGKRLAVASTLNPQTRFGDDVVSRIELAQREAEGLQALRRVLVDCLDDHP
ncbi:MAG: 2Fe-2S iron-sulfur cluster-binding protein, partial [Anaerolineae bacterium]|nr:2Fe-2S iron-sulfur cluster-binding protein [Anaerolineae bacterium]